MPPREPVVRVLDRSGRLLKKGMKVQILHDVKLLERLVESHPAYVGHFGCSEDVSAFIRHNMPILGEEAEVLDVDLDDHSVEVKTQGFDPVWFPDLFLEEVGESDHPALELYESMFDNPQCTDVTFKLADGEVQAHKCVLAAASSVFARMFASSMRESFSGVVELLDCKRQTLLVLLRFLYTGQVDSKDWSSTDEASEVMPLDLVLDVLKVAKTYMIDSVTRASTEVVKERLADVEQEPRAIEKILAYAIAADLGGVRMAAIKAAESNPQLRKLYDEKDLRPEVMADLQAIWSVPVNAEPKKKRPRWK